MAGSAIMVALGNFALDDRVMKMAAAMRRVHSDFMVVGTSEPCKSGLRSPTSRMIANLKCLFFPDGSLVDEEAVNPLLKLQASLAYFSTVICDHVEQLAPESVHTHDVLTLVVGREIKRRMGDRVRWVHDVRVPAHNDADPDVQDWLLTLEAEHLPYADWITTQNSELQTELLQRHETLPPITAIYNAPLLRDITTQTSIDPWEVQERRLVEVYLRILGFDGQVIDTVTRCPVSAGPLRVLHGVTGAAGQPGTLARALNGQPGIYAKSLQIARSKFAYPSDIFYPVRRADAASMLDVMGAVFEDFDIFHMHSRGFVFDRKHTAFPTGQDILALKAAGKSVVIHFRGSEARIQSLFEKFSPYNYVEDDEESTVGKFPEDAKRRHIRLATAIADRVFVPDPELQSYVPGSTVVERAIDLAEWQNVGVKPNSRPLIVHAPSRRGVKGTRAVIAAVENLQLRGFEFDFKLVEGLPQAEARKIYEQADIVVDQLRIGWYGVLAVECMALGKPVIAYIRDDLHHTFEDGLPLANANPTNIEQVLERLLTNESERFALAAKGRAYVERVHCSTVIANKLVEIYKAIRQTPRPIDIAAYLEVLKEQAATQDRAVVKANASLAKIKSLQADLAKANKAAKAMKKKVLPASGKIQPTFSTRLHAARKRAEKFGLAPTMLFLVRRAGMKCVKVLKT